MKALKTRTASICAAFMLPLMAQAVAAAEKQFMLPPCSGLESEGQLPVASPETAKPTVTTPAKMLEPMKLEPAAPASRNWIDAASEVNLMPLPLTQSTQEKVRKEELIISSEAAQLKDLWGATINRYPDIQFAINRMQPNSDRNHAASMAMKAVSKALFDGAQAATYMMTPNMGFIPRLSTGTGLGMLNKLLHGGDAKQQKLAQISEEQATVLYQMVRNVADRLTTDYRLYKSALQDFDRASTDFEEIRRVVEAAAAKDPAAVVWLDYVVRSAARDRDRSESAALLYRAKLVDYAGKDQVAKLDEEIDQERNALATMLGDQLPKINDRSLPVFSAPRVKQLQLKMPA